MDSFNLSNNTVRWALFFFHPYFTNKESGLWRRCDLPRCQSWDATKQPGLKTHAFTQCTRPLPFSALVRSQGVRKACKLSSAAKRQELVFISGYIQRTETVHCHGQVTSGTHWDQMESGRGLFQGQGPWCRQTDRPWALEPSHEAVEHEKMGPSHWPLSARPPVVNVCPLRIVPSIYVTLKNQTEFHMLFHQIFIRTSQPGREGVIVIILQIGKLRLGKLKCLTKSPNRWPNQK